MLRSNVRAKGARETVTVKLNQRKVMPDMAEIGGLVQTTDARVEIATTINDRLKSKKLRLESELKDVNEALDALNANPEIARVLSLVGKAVGRL